jgi:prepilin signal peptidase PulO-like enzyme (type II secretory pathway)
MMLLGQATRKSALPFAPYLSLATVVEVFWGEAIWNWYINLIL